MQSRFQADPGRCEGQAADGCRQAPGRSSCGTDELVMVFDDGIQELYRRQVGLNPEERFHFLGEQRGRNGVSSVTIDFERLVNDLQIAIVELSCLRKGWLITFFGTGENVSGARCFCRHELDNRGTRRDVTQSLTSAISGNRDDCERTAKEEDFNESKQ